MYLDDLAKKTHRGLEGQFLRHFHPGGHLFGYRTTPVYVDGAPKGPRDERRVDGYKVGIHEEEAAIVRRIFDLYANQQVSVNEITRTLNAQGTTWPGATTMKAKNRKGWAHSSIVSILDSEKYRGVWIWNKKRWFKDPTDGKRRYVKREEGEWQTSDMPELALIDAETWAKTVARREAAKKKFPHFGSKPASGNLAGTPTRYLLSGLLVCAECRGSMSITGGGGKRRADGTRAEYSNYSCVNASRKGASFCTNTSSISRRKIESVVVEGIAEKVLHPDAIATFRKKFMAEVDLQRAENRSANRLVEVEREIAKSERTVGRLIELFASDVGSMDEVRQALSKERSRLALLTKEADDLRAASRPEDSLPSAAMIDGYLQDLAGTLDRDRTKARALLEKHVGKITLRKELGPGRFRASGRFELGPSLRSQVVAGTGFEPVTFGL